MPTPALAVLLRRLIVADAEETARLIDGLCVTLADQAGTPARHAELWALLGGAWTKLGQAADAADAWDAAATLDPAAAADALLTLAAAGDFGAEPWIRAAALRPWPTCAAVWTAHAVARIAASAEQDGASAGGTGTVTDAGVDAALAQALGLDPAYRPALRLAARRALNAADYDRAADLFAAADAARDPDAPTTGGDAEDALAWLTALARSSREDTAELTQAADRWAALRPRPPLIAPAPTDPTGRRLRVGVCQAWFHTGAYLNAMGPTLSALGRRTHLVGCNVGPTQGGRAPDLYGDAFSGWLELGGASADAAAAAVAAETLDLLIDLEGASLHAPMALYARRPAPVIATWMNALCGLGPGGFDWLITDWECVPPGAENAYAERIARPPAPFAFQTMVQAHRPPSPQDAPPPCLGGGGPIFGAMAQPFKITPALAQCWTDLLAARPDARLILRSHRWAAPREKAKAERLFSAAGVDWRRVEIQDRSLSPRDHLAWFTSIDVLLDSFPFPGVSTAFEALWMGRPVVARRGDRLATRMAWSILHAAHCGDWAATDVAAYRRIALDLVADPAALAARCAGLRDQVAASPLCDVEGFSVAIEALCRTMVETAWLSFGK